MEKKRKKEQERRKAFKADRQDKMSHVSVLCYSHLHYYVLFISHPLAFTWVVLVSTREVEGVGSVQ